MSILYHFISGIPIRGIIFDMDGTLTHPCIDFKKMRERLAIPSGDVLRIIDSYNPTLKQEALRIIDEVEEEGRNQLKLQRGIGELLTYLSKKGIKHGVVTRNSEKSINHFIDHLKSTEKIPDSFAIKLTREFPLPYKPDPASSLHICKEWNLNPHEVMFVGDFRDDLLCGNSAGNVTCLLNNELNGEFTNLADLNVKRLDELIHYLENGFEVKFNDKWTSTKTDIFKNLSTSKVK